ncbi:MAG: flavodoxin [Muribaculaceae bacterium]|nr:flavodoxin [Muribaculaceae bacterium]
MNVRNILKSVVTIAALLFSFNLSAAAPATKAKKDMKSIIVYFSHSGNTELAAEKLAEVTGSPIVRILPAEPYTAADVDWVNEQSRCTQEHLNQTLRPAIKPLDVDFSQYDTVFIGFPIWWHEEPAVIRTFLDNTDLKGKELYPFCTSYESPMSEADATLQKAYPTLKWHTGLRLPASTEKIKDWIDK